MYCYENVKGEKLTIILYSPGFGAGWGTWNDLAIAYDERLIEWLINNVDDSEFKYAMPYVSADDTIEISEFFDHDAFEEFVKALYPDTYCGGLRDLTVYFAPTGTKILIEEYDGSESINKIDDLPYIQT